jgi:polyisoprenoid-binding protein YceI
MAQNQQLTTTNGTQTLWKIDPAHSSVGFGVKHLMVSTTRGRFHAFDATLVLDDADLGLSRLEAEIEVASIDTGAKDRDAHLRSADFFDAENHPRMTFRSTQVERLGRDRARVRGDLTIRGVTRAVELHVTRDGQLKDPWGNHRAAFTASTSIDRRDYGLTWNQVLEAGGFLVGDKVKIEIQAQFMQQADPPDAYTLRPPHPRVLHEARNATLKNPLP